MNFAVKLNFPQGFHCESKPLLNIKIHTPLQLHALDPSNFGREGFEVRPCPAKLPHDVVVGDTIALWIAEGYNDWFIGKVEEVNRRRTVTDNVLIKFDDGPAWHVAREDAYGIDRYWVLLKPVA